MFDFLDDVESARVISAVYYAVRLISHRSRLVSIYEGFKAETLESEPSPEDEQLALSILNMIEETEGTDLPNLDYSTAEEYILDLYRIAQQRADDEFGFNIERGRELLGQFQPAISQQVSANN